MSDYTLQSPFSADSSERSRRSVPQRQKKGNGNSAIEQRQTSEIVAQGPTTPAHSMTDPDIWRKRGESVESRKGILSNSKRDRRRGGSHRSKLNWNSPPSTALQQEGSGHDNEYDMAARRVRFHNVNEVRHISESPERSRTTRRFKEFDYDNMLLDDNSSEDSWSSFEQSDDDEQQQEESFLRGRPDKNVHEPEPNGSSGKERNGHIEGLPLVHGEEHSSIPMATKIENSEALEQDIEDEWKHDSPRVISGNQRETKEGEPASNSLIDLPDKKAAGSATMDELTKLILAGESMMKEIKKDQFQATQNLGETKNQGKLFSVTSSSDTEVMESKKAKHDEYKMASIIAARQMQRAKDDISLKMGQTIKSISIDSGSAQGPLTPLTQSKDKLLQNSTPASSPPPLPSHNASLSDQSNSSTPKRGILKTPVDKGKASPASPDSSFAVAIGSPLPQSRIPRLPANKADPHAIAEVKQARTTLTRRLCALWRRLGEIRLAEAVHRSGTRAILLQMLTGHTFPPLRFLDLGVDSPKSSKSDNADVNAQYNPLEGSPVAIASPKAIEHMSATQRASHAELQKTKSLLLSSILMARKNIRCVMRLTLSKWAEHHRTQQRREMEYDYKCRIVYWPQKVGQCFGSWKQVVASTSQLKLLKIKMAKHAMNRKKAAQMRVCMAAWSLAVRRRLTQAFMQMNDIASETSNEESSSITEKVQESNDTTDQEYSPRISQSDNVSSDQSELQPLNNASGHPLSLLDIADSPLQQEQGVTDNLPKKNISNKIKAHRSQQNREKFREAKEESTSPHQSSENYRKLDEPTSDEELDPGSLLSETSSLRSAKDSGNQSKSEEEILATKIRLANMEIEKLDLASRELEAISEDIVDEQDKQTIAIELKSIQEQIYANQQQLKNYQEDLLQLLAPVSRVPLNSISGANGSQKNGRKIHRKGVHEHEGQSKESIFANQMMSKRPHGDKTSSPNEPNAYKREKNGGLASELARAAGMNMDLRSPGSEGKQAKGSRSTQSGHVTGDRNIRSSDGKLAKRDLSESEAKRRQGGSHQGDSSHGDSFRKRSGSNSRSRSNSKSRNRMNSHDHGRVARHSRNRHTDDESMSTMSLRSSGSSLLLPVPQ